MKKEERVGHKCENIILFDLDTHVPQGHKHIRTMTWPMRAEV